jgi:hypothetical protein
VAQVVECLPANCKVVLPKKKNCTSLYNLEFYSWEKYLSVGEKLILVCTRSEMLHNHYSDGKVDVLPWSTIRSGSNRKKIEFSICLCGIVPHKAPCVQTYL